VGLDLAHIVATAANDLNPADIDNGKWRLPTPAEQQAYTGRNSNGAYTAHWHTLDGSGVKGGMFPDATLGDATTFLPAAGGRKDNSGAVGAQGSNGYYWSATPLSTASGLYLDLRGTSVFPANAAYYAYGFSVRCVRQ